MLKKYLLPIVAFLPILLTVTPSYAFWWMGYHKPAFRGRVIDAETKLPIEGAVVVVTYQKDAIRIAPEGVTEIVEVRETFTDRGGNFYFPPYTTIVDPLAWEGMANFIIYKPGYGNFPEHQEIPSGIAPVDHETFFSKNLFGSKGEMELWVRGEKAPDLKRVEVTFGVVELPRFKTREERRLNIPSLPSWDEFLDEQKNLLRLINEEEENLGLEKSDPYKSLELLKKKIDKKKK